MLLQGAGFKFGIHYVFTDISFGKEIDYMVFQGVDLPASSFLRPSPSSSVPLLSEPNDLKAIELLVNKLLLSARLATFSVLVAGAVAAGDGLRSRFSSNRNTVLGGVVALCGAATYALNVIMSYDDLTV
ncbi:hypothetical protein SESBI_13588 [Sesbania bispinosa]|nr:hypothetical protein SESBI_13588 [Sesbania bispinosa]